MSRRGPVRGLCSRSGRPPGRPRPARPGWPRRRAYAPSPLLSGTVSCWPGCVAGWSTAVAVVPDDQPDVPVWMKRRPAFLGQRARQQVRLAQDLEAVADAEHRQPRRRRRHQLGHHRREPGDRAAAQVVAVGEAAGEDHRVHAAQVPVGVPERDWHRPGVAHGAGRIGVVEEPGNVTTPIRTYCSLPGSRLRSAKCPSSAGQGRYALRASGGSQAIRLSSTTRVPPARRGPQRRPRRRRRS